MKHDWVMWGSLATAGAALCSFILAAISLAGIRLANRGVKVAENSTFLARRNYLDNLVSNILNSASEYAAKGLPYWSKKAEAHSKKYLDFHLSRTKLEVALTMLDLSGLPELPLPSNSYIKNDLEDILEATYWAIGAHYDSLISPPGENRELEYEFDEIWKLIINVTTWEKLPETSRKRIQGVYEDDRTYIRELVEETGDPKYWICATRVKTDKILRMLVYELSDNYGELIDLVAPWNSHDKQKFWIKFKVAFLVRTSSIISRVKVTKWTIVKRVVKDSK